MKLRLFTLILLVVLALFAGAAPASADHYWQRSPGGSSAWLTS